MEACVVVCGSIVEACVVVYLIYMGFRYMAIFVANMGLSIQEWTKQNFLKTVFHKFYLVHSRILCRISVTVLITTAAFVTA